MKGIPTKHKNIQFRSRLEAHWAAFFDEMGWPWEYEPFDLDGYIPDFVLKFKNGPVLVEVKPSMNVLRALPGTSEENDPIVIDAQKKIEKSGWKGSSLVVGATMCDGSKRVKFDSLVLGSFLARGDEKKYWDDAILFSCNGIWCHSLSIMPSMSSVCIRCGKEECLDGTDLEPKEKRIKRRWVSASRVSDSALEFWANAKNSVQWMGANK